MNMAKEVNAKPKDCTACRLVGAAGLVGIGGYLANYAWKNKTFAGKLALSTFSLGEPSCIVLYNVVVNGNVKVSRVFIYPLQCNLGYLL